MTYWIRTKQGCGREQVLIRSIVITRQKHIGTDREYIHNNVPSYTAMDAAQELFNGDYLFGLSLTSPDPGETAPGEAGDEELDLGRKFQENWKKLQSATIMRSIPQVTLPSQKWIRKRFKHSTTNSAEKPRSKKNPSGFSLTRS